MEETGNGTITRYIRGLGIISSDSEEAKTYYHYVSDEQGSITHVLSEDAENRFCYNGEMLDPVTQQDTYYGDGLNLYQYCQANPVGYVDPSGHNICPTQLSLYKKYKVSARTDNALLNQIEVVVTENIPGVCAEPKAATVAHYNKTRYYTTKKVPHGHDGSNQMDACDTCKKNMEVYIRYAKNK